MTDGISRRGVLRGALAGSALCIGVSLTGGLGCGGAQKRRMRRADDTGELEANMYITVLPTGVIRLAVNKSEIGQGVTTGYATLVAEELEVEVEDIDFYFADSLQKYRTSGLEGVPMFRLHATGGSTSLREAFVPLRRASAAAREMLVAAAAQQWNVSPGACRAQAGHVVHKQSGRKLGYGQLTKHAARQSAPRDPRIKKPGEFRLIGKRTRRVDAEAKVTGAAVFGIDVQVANMVRAYVIHPPSRGAQAKSVRADAATSMPGVIGVLSFDFGVAVVAEKYWQAQAAAAGVAVEWRSVRAGLTTAKLAVAARNYRKSGAVVTEHGDAKDAVRTGDAVVQAVYEAPYLTHAPLEPQNCTVSVKKAGRVEVWAPCQVPTTIQEAVADAVGVDADDVLVHTTYCGGGFGGRLLGDVAAQAAKIAKKVRRPVQLIWSRESDMSQGSYRPAVTAFLRGSVIAGRAEALHYHCLSQPIAANQLESTRGGQPSWLPRFTRQVTAKSMSALFNANTNIDWFATEGASDTPYRIANRRFEYTPVKTDVPVGFWRSVGHSFNGFIMEGFVDELAHAAGRDPYAFRRQMLKKDSRELRVLDAVAELSGWGDAAAPGFARGIVRHTAFGTEVAEVAEAGVVDGRIRVTRVWCAVDCGIAVNPDVVAAQMEGGIIFGLSAALDQEITWVDGVVQQKNYDSYPTLRMFECPEVIVKVMPSEADPTGVGEPGLPPIAPAVANAVFAATGVRLRRMPLQRAWREHKKGARP